MIEVPETRPGVCEFEFEIEDWLFKLAHFKSKPKHKIPVLICYAFINRPYILDLHEDVSVIKKMLEAKLDVWLIDWGYPKRADKYLQLSDYIDFIDRCVEYIRQKRGVDAVTLHGYCLGSTLSVIYTSMFPEKIKNLVLQAPPVDFYTTNTLAEWARNINPEKIARALGNATGDMLNLSFLLVDPIRLVVGKYQSLLDNMNNEKFLRNFFYMDHWIFDSPAVPGNVYVEYITRWYHRNEVINGVFEYRGRKIDISNLKMPVLVLAAEKDHITPPESVKPFFERIPSKDKKMILSDKGHIGLTVSGSSQKKVWPEAIKWIVDRSD
ncbi:MAG TPA: alpha/beta fold hydrolase [Candidatus Marinimicrobia bacterium]|nr:alpha/beta fold hydrolase [Candidatus Neomarinimicrobiota bacterium]